MASRSASTLLIGGTTHFQITPSVIRKMSSTAKKVPLGIRKLLVPPPSSAATMDTVSWSMLSDYCRPGVAKTNSAMNARLMK